MEIERNYYDEALRQSIIDDETEDKEEMAQMVRDIGKLMEKQVRILDLEKRAWFEGLSGGIIEFAKACSFNVKVWITDSLCGIIRLESSFFELDWRDPSELHAFWTYLQCTADAFNITLCEEVFRIEFHFHLYSLHKAE